ncbi:MAG TPA: response regulator [Gemmatimonadetes bacterium]|nr:response regulator [Gemmatimonadota bacterium]
MATILVVDDDPELRVLVKSALELCQHEVLSAENGVQALEQLDRHTIELVITDVNMPEMDGIELLVELRNERPDLPIIVMSGGGIMEREVLLENARALGAFQTMMKPLDPNEIEKVVEGVLGHSSKE